LDRVVQTEIFIESEPFHLRWADTIGRLELVHVSFNSGTKHNIFFKKKHYFRDQVLLKFGQGGSN
jgi:hypothetical protein